jgi:hypothetical protein
MDKSIQSNYNQKCRTNPSGYSIRNNIDSRIFVLKDNVVFGT